MSFRSIKRSTFTIQKSFALLKIRWSLKLHRPSGKTVLIAAGIILLMILITGAFRNILLNYALKKKLNGYSLRLGARLSYEKASFSGFSTIEIQNMSLVPENSDTLALIRQINIRIKPLALLRMRLRFGNVQIKQPSLFLHRVGNQSNYLFLLDRKKSGSTKITAGENSPANYAQRISGLFNAFFNHVPSSLNIEHFLVKAAINHHRFSFSFPRLNINDNYFRTRAVVTDDSLSRMWQIAGIVNPHINRVALSVVTLDSLKVQIPYINQRWKTIIAFDSASVNLSYSEPESESARLEGKAILYGSLLNNARIAPGDVRMERSEVDYRLNFGKSFIELDSASRISFNKTSFNPFVRFDNQPEKRLRIRIHRKDLVAQDFFSSLPDGLFTNFTDIQVKGKLGFNLDFDYVFSRPDSLLFSAALTSGDFRVVRFGSTDFTSINQPFLYTAYENGQAVRQFMVGPENSDFRTLDQVPAYLKNAIMTSEDGSFYYHNGFVPDAIRASIITNIKEKRFARGGSTITMQLVKNVFLNRHKNITRKIEEMLITWMIESRQLVSKDRMFEVYLNIIETGPMVYGVNEAARFYFDKDVSKLSLAESIYLASIVPKPKWFRYSFDDDGNLREYLQSYYSLVSGKMLNKQWISQEEYDQLKPEIQLKGPARDLVLPADSIPEVEEHEKDIL